MNHLTYLIPPAMTPMGYNTIPNSNWETYDNKTSFGTPKGSGELSNMKEQGKGMWTTIHWAGIEAKDSISKAFFIQLLRLYAKRFTCLECRDELRHYLELYPPEKEIDLWSTETGEDIGAFAYSWRMHNSVNQRIGKKPMDWDTAYNLYRYQEDQVCSKDCGSTPKNSTPASSSLEYLSTTLPGVIQVLTPSQTYKYT